MINGLPEGAINCWFVTKAQMKDVKAGLPFIPDHLVFAYFMRVSRMRENTIEGYLGHPDFFPNYHHSITTQYGYFNEYRAGEPVYLTFDKVKFYFIDEIEPSNPLLFLLKRVDLTVETSETTGDRRISPTVTVKRLPFGDLDGGDFERLVYAYVESLFNSHNVSWLGEAGQDKGRDIWAEGQGKSYCYQCANFRSLTWNKAKGDIDKLVRHGYNPDLLLVVCGGSVSANLTTKIIDYAIKAGFSSVEVWNGAKLEERLRNTAPTLIERFFKGIAFPEKEIRKDIEKTVEEEPPTLEILLEPVFGIKGTDEEIGVFIEEAFYALDKGRNCPVEVRIIGEEVLRTKLKTLDRSTLSAVERREKMSLKKIIDLLTELRNEVIEKVSLLYYADLYPVRHDYDGLAKSLKQILLISITPHRLYEETDLTLFIDGKADYTKALKFKGKTKLNLHKRMNDSVIFTLYLNDDELESVISGRVKPEQLHDLWFYDLDCSIFSIDILVEKAIPSFIDKIYEFKHSFNIIDIEDNTSWKYLPSYVLSLG